MTKPKILEKSSMRKRPRKRELKNAREAEVVSAEEGVVAILNKRKRKSNTKSERKRTGGPGKTMSTESRKSLIRRGNMMINNSLRRNIITKKRNLTITIKKSTFPKVTDLMTVARVASEVTEVAVVAETNSSSHSSLSVSLRSTSSKRSRRL